MFGPYLESAVLLGRRTAELHAALASETDTPHFGQEPFTYFYQRSLYQSVRTMVSRILAALRRRLARLPEDVQTLGKSVMAREEEVIERLRPLLQRNVTAMRIRCHGDYHLGQVLYTGSDFVIIDFEGEASRSISERQLKASPLRDVAGMLRSFDYVCYTALADQLTGTLSPEERARLRGWMHFWTTWTGATFVRSYLQVAEGQSFVPRPAENVQLLLNVYLLEKAFHELRYELGSRPDWVRIPLHGIQRLLDQKRSV